AFAKNNAEIIITFTVNDTGRYIGTANNIRSPAHINEQIFVTRTGFSHRLIFAINTLAMIEPKLITAYTIPTVSLLSPSSTMSTFDGYILMSDAKKLMNTRNTTIGLNTLDFMICLAPSIKSFQNVSSSVSSYKRSS